MIGNNYEEEFALEIHPIAIINVVKLTMLLLLLESHEDTYIPLVEAFSKGE